MATTPKLLPRGSLVKTSELDQADWNYQGLLGLLSRRRFAMVVKLLDPRPVPRLLEVGYASGILMPELARRATRLDGVDVHPETAAVTAALAAEGITAELATGSVTALPYDDATFDTVVCVSTLEFVDDLDTACSELARVLRPGGALVVVTPGYGRVLDTGLKLLSGERAEDTFKGRRQRIVPTLARHFATEGSLTFPPLAPGPLRLYTTLRLTPR